MTNFKEFFEAIQQSISSDEFVKLTVSKPLRKSEGLLNVYVRFFKIDGKDIFEFKYRYMNENIFKRRSLETSLIELEKLLLETFRAATLFTLNYDLIVMVSKKKQISCRDTAPSFKNKLPELLQESQKTKE